MREFAASHATVPISWSCWYFAGSNLFFQFWLATFFPESFHKKLVSILISSFFIVCIPRNFVNVNVKRLLLRHAAVRRRRPVHQHGHVPATPQSLNEIVAHRSPIMLANSWHTWQEQRSDFKQNLSGRFFFFFGQSTLVAATVSEKGWFNRNEVSNKKVALFAVSHWMGYIHLGGPEITVAG